MSLVMNVGPDNLLPSGINGLPATPTKASWFDGALTINYSCDTPVAVLLDFASDQYLLFITVNGWQSNYVSDGYVTPGYVQDSFSELNPDYVDHEYVSSDYVVE